MRGVFLHKSTMGYTVNVDGHDLGLDVGWSAANKLAGWLFRQMVAGDE